MFLFLYFGSDTEQTHGANVFLICRPSASRNLFLLDRALGRRLTFDKHVSGVLNWRVGSSVHITVEKLNDGEYVHQSGSWGGDRPAAVMKTTEMRWLRRLIRRICTQTAMWNLPDSNSSTRRHQSSIDFLIQRSVIKINRHFVQNVELFPSRVISVMWCASKPEFSSKLLNSDWVNCFSTRSHTDVQELNGRLFKSWKMKDWFKVKERRPAWMIDPLIVSSGFWYTRDARRHGRFSLISVGFVNNKINIKCRLTVRGILSNTHVAVSVRSPAASHPNVIDLWAGGRRRCGLRPFI